MSQTAVQVQRLLQKWTDGEFSTASRLLWQAGLPSRMLQLPPDWWDSSCAIDSGLWLVRERGPSARIWLVNQNDATLQLTWQPIGSENATPPAPEQLDLDVLSLWPGRQQLPRFWSLPRSEAAALILEGMLWIGLAVLLIQGHPGALLVPVLILLLRSHLSPLPSSLRATQLAVAALQQWLRLPLRTVVQLQNNLGSGLIQLLLQAGQRQPEVLRGLLIPLVTLTGATLLLLLIQPLLGLGLLGLCFLWLLSHAALIWSNRALIIHRDQAFERADQRSLALLRINASLRLAAAEDRALSFWRTPQQEGLLWQRRLDRNRTLALLCALFCTGASIWLGLNASRPLQVLPLIALQLASSQLLSHQIQNLVSLQLEWKAGQGLLASTPEWQPGATDPGALQGAIDFEAISYRYSERSSWALQDLSVQIPAGSYVALVGPTGSGKSTLLHLLLGFAEAQHGVLRFDGTDARLLQQDQLRPQIGAMLQDGRLVGHTIWDVLAAGRPLTMTAAMEALDAVGFLDDLKTLPMGLETPLPGEGRQLSGGQRQKLAIARALIGQPKLLLLDEPTSALDPRSQATVLSTLRQLHCTRLLIAHRLSTVKEADLILVLQNGQLVQQGDYASLANSDGAFRALMQQQGV